MTDAASLNEFVEWGLKKVRPVLGLTVYLKVPLADVKEATAHALNVFLGLAESELTWYADYKIDRYRRATPQLVRYPLRWLDEPNAGEKSFAWIMFGAEEYVDAPAYLFKGYSVERNPHSYLSYLRVTVPIDGWVDDSDRFVRLVKDVVSDLPIYYGYGGIFFGESDQMSHQQVNSRFVYAAAMRYQGIEVDRPRTTAVSVRHAIKGVNWLTLIHDDFVATLGGRDALRSKLGADIVFHDLPHGLMLQAGARPSAGDVNAGDRLPAYREVARALKPIRTDKHPQLGASHDQSFGDAGTAAWMRRLDD